MDLTLQWLSPVPVILERCRVEFRHAGAHVELDLADVSDVAFELADPVREFPSWPGKRHFNGYFWMSQMARSVGFESLVERSFLMELDRLGSARAVASQPMWLKTWEPEFHEHFPDYFVRMSSGEPVLVDVRPTELIDDHARSQFDRTSSLCERMGWRYVVFEGLSPIRDANLRFLLRYREVQRAERVPDIPSEGMPLQDVVDALGGGTDGMLQCYGMLWHKQLETDLEIELSRGSVLHGAAPTCA